MRRLIGPTLLSLSYTHFDSKEDSRPHKYNRRCPVTETVITPACAVNALHGLDIHTPR